MTKYALQRGGGASPGDGQWANLGNADVGTCGGRGLILTARAWQQLVQASAVPGYGYRYRRWVLDSLRYVDVQDLATGGDHIPELDDVYVDVALVSRPPHQAPGGQLVQASEDSS